MKEYTLTAYSFDELGKEAQDKALEDHARFLDEVMDCADIALTMNESLASLILYRGDGVYCPLKVEDWDISYTQGRHVGIAGEISRDLAPGISWPTGSDSVILSYHHYYGQQVRLFDKEGEELDVSDEFKESIYQLSRKLMEAGVKELEYQVSLPVVKDSIVNNDYEFNLNGSLIPRKYTQLISA